MIDWVAVKLLVEKMEGAIFPLRIHPFKDGTAAAVHDPHTDELESPLAIGRWTNP